MLIMAINELSVHGKTGHLMTYNKAIADATGAALAQTPGVRVSTIHSLALQQALRANLVDRTRIGSLGQRDIVDFIGEPGTLPIYGGIQKTLHGLGVKVPKDAFHLSPYEMGVLVKNSLDVFLQSGDFELSPAHVALDSVIDKIETTLALCTPETVSPMYSKLLSIDSHEYETRRITDLILGRTKQVWADLSKYDGRLTLPHDAYLKLYVNALYAGTAKLPQGNYFMVDEFQDARRLILRLMEKAQEAGKQIIAVGDPRQHIYGYMGNTNGFEILAFEEIVKLTKSFRFGPEIADMIQTYVREVMHEPDYVLEGNPEIPSGVDNSFSRYNAIICRTNAGVLSATMEELNKGGTHRGSVYVPRAQDILKLADDLYALKSGASATGPLKGCRNLGDLDSYLQEEGRTLEKTVQTIQTLTKKDLYAMIEKVSVKEGSDTVIMTAHGAKGLEFEYVQLYQDFIGVRKKVEKGDVSLGLQPHEGVKGPDAMTQENNLLFVALSRAIHGINPYGLEKIVPLPMPPNGKVAADVEHRRRGGLTIKGKKSPSKGAKILSFQEKAGVGHTPLAKPPRKPRAAHTKPANER